MAIAFVAASSGSSAFSATSVLIAVPAGTVNGYVMVACVTTNGETTTISPPAGWTAIRGDAYSAAGRQQMWYRVASSEPANYTWTVVAGSSLAGGIISLSGVDTTTPTDGDTGAASNDGLTSIIAPSITTSVANTMLVGFFGAHDSATSIAVATGMTERIASVHPDVFTTLEAATEAVVAIGATGTRSATANVAARDLAQMVAMRPATAGCLGLLLGVG